MTPCAHDWAGDFCRFCGDRLNPVGPDRLNPVQPAPVGPDRPCMDADEAAEWQRFNDLLPRSSRAESPCGDCTGWFAVHMKLAGRCDSWPVAEDGGRPRKRTADQRRQAERRRWRESKARTRARVRA